ncbi:MAG: cysteine hydrolase [Methanomassiliicoccaceae archaeon]|jgi:nicotinamidase-related amidase|nr:cysteine hydrolase [Methanomassiliicoccaceae archaeon]
MRKLLLVIDMQNDFIAGSLGSPQAERIVMNVKAKIDEYRRDGNRIIFTRDTHGEDYLTTQEGRFLPVAHCIRGTYGHKITDVLDVSGCTVFDKPTFGSMELAEMICKENFNEIEICGLCTDICVVSNALIIKARMPETKVTVDAGCCAGVTVESHNAALMTMRMCQVNIIGTE